MASRQKRSKDWGYEVERQAEAALRLLDNTIERTGGSKQKVRGAPDLSSLHRNLGAAPLLLVVTKDKGAGRPLLVTLAMPDFLTIATTGFPRGEEVHVQVKGRAATWIGSLYCELKECVAELKKARKL